MGNTSTQWENWYSHSSFTSGYMCCITPSANLPDFCASYNVITPNKHKAKLAGVFFVGFLKTVCVSNPTVKKKIFFFVLVKEHLVVKRKSDCILNCILQLNNKNFICNVVKKKTTKNPEVMLHFPNRSKLTFSAFRKLWSFINTNCKNNIELCVTA